MYVLGLESSCDETSAAVLHDGKILSNIISSQFFHSAYGGVVPELASRAHLRALIPIVDRALQEAGIVARDIHLCAATQGPGLIGSLLVGLNFAKGFSLSYSIPLIPIHHIEAHMFSPFLQEGHPTFPFLCLVVSGGHTLIVHVRAVGQYQIIGSTKDDAAGEAFDKVAKLLGLGFPGGPFIDQHAKLGNPNAISFPRAMLNDDSFDFSFSGLKTSVLYFLKKQNKLKSVSTTVIGDSFINDVAASFQRAIVDVLTAKLFAAVKIFRVQDIAVVGGVSANSELKQRILEMAQQKGIQVYIPAIDFCTDNAAMIAYLGYLKYCNSVPIPGRIEAFARSSQFSFP